jgi:CheY-like chemotaxis protein
VSPAADFRLALDILESSDAIDLMLTDIVMPRGVNGVALGRMARMRRRDIRLMYMTAYDIPGVEAETDGPVLRKPVSAERLIAEVERVLGRG